MVDTSTDTNHFLTRLNGHRVHKALDVFALITKSVIYTRFTNIGHSYYTVSNLMPRESSKAFMELKSPLVTGPMVSLPVT